MKHSTGNTASGPREVSGKMVFDIRSTRMNEVMFTLPLQDLSKADLSEKDLSLADLRGCDLSFSDLTNCNLTRADLSGSDLSCASLRGCAVIGATFDRACLSSCTGLDKIRPHVSGISGFYMASWRGCDFTGVDLSWVDLDHIKDPDGFFHGCTGLPDGFVQSLMRKKRGLSAFGM